MEQLKLSFTDQQVKDQVQIVLGFGKRTIEESFKLGEMLVLKKEEKKHGEWLPFLEEIGLSQSTTQRLITAFKEKDNYIEGMTFSELARDNKLPESGNLNKMPEPEPDPFANWSQEEKDLKDKWDKGNNTIIINIDKHHHLKRYAIDLQVYVSIDRGSGWGNPFYMGSDGSRDEVCDWYEQYYFPYKKSLHQKIGNLKGKMLGCHCYPERCHGETILKWIENEKA
jgi:hypothetical protein